MTTRLDANNIAAGSITSDRIANNAVTLDKLPVGTFGPRITSVVLPGSQTAISPAGGETVVINGSGFGLGVQVYFGSALAPVITRISSTQLSVITPVLNPSTYTLYVTNTDGGTAIRLLAITASASPVWATGSTLPTVGAASSISIQLAAPSDSAVTYSVAVGSTLPPGLSLSSSGLITGSVTGISADTIYNFTVNAIDAELQNSTRSFTITISVGDQYFLYTSLLLKTSAVSTRSTVVTDSSTNAFTVTRNGTPSTGWVSPYQTDGYWGNYFNGSTDYLDVAASTAFNLTGSFTVECWFYLTAPPANNNDGNPFACLVNYWTSVVAQTGWEFTIRTGASGIITFSRPGGTGAVAITASYTTFALNTWYHVAVTYNGTTGAIYLNGTALTPTTNAWSWAAPSSPTLRIGRGFSTGYLHYFPGYISNLRITNGTVVYTGTFTPPTTPLAATQSAGTNIAAITGTQTSLLTCQSNRFKDNGTANGGLPFTITPSGTPQVTGYWYPSTFTAPAASPGAALFNGTTDYLSTPANFSGMTFGTGAFCVEVWIYPFATVSNAGIIVWNTYAGDSRVGIQYYSNTGLGIATGAAWQLFTSSVPTTNQWTHLVINRNSSGTMSIYFNGVRQTTATNSNNFTSGLTYNIGKNDTNLFNGYMSNFRIVVGNSVYDPTLTTLTVPITPVTAIANTSLLVNLADSNFTSATNAVQNNTFIDTGPYAFTITRNGSPTQGSVTPYWPDGQWSNYFSGSGQYLTTPASASNQMTGDFTVELWAYQTVAAAGGLVGINNTVSSGGANFGIYLVSDRRISFFIAGNTTEYSTVSSVISLNTWNHIAFVRSGTTNTVYVNGIVVLTNSAAASWSGTPVITVGRLFGDNTGLAFPGYLSNVRIVKGVAVYSGASTTVANFTVPTTPLTTTQSARTNIAAITGTSTYFLSCQSNRFRDNSTNNFTFTVAGTPQVQAFQPFSPTAAYTTALYGGSGYFNGSTDYLTVTNVAAIQPGSGNFTYEAWVYPTSPGGGSFKVLWSQRSNSTGGAGGWGPLIAYTASTLLFYISNAAGTGWQLDGVSTGIDLTINAWQHLALVRSGNTLTLYKNGVAGTPASVATGAIATGGNLALMAGAADGAQKADGYMSNYRMVKGTAVYTGAFTPPSLAPLQTSGSASVACYPSTTNVNTSFTASDTGVLINFANAGIYDASMQNYAITVGSSQVSSTTAKWGTTSMKFNGSTDYLTMPVINLGSGATASSFTVEGWFYTTSAASDQTIISQYVSSSSGWCVRVVSSRLQAQLAGDPASIVSTTTILSNTWYYFAFSGSVGSWKLFMGTSGTTIQEGSTQTGAVNLGDNASLGLQIGRLTTISYFNGYIQDLRITRGIVRYTTPPAVPTSEFLAK
jgi:hypothetical protein